MRDILFISLFLITQLSYAQDKCVRQYKVDSSHIVYFCPDFNYNFEPLRFLKINAGLTYKDTIHFIEIDFDRIKQIEYDLPIQLVDLNKSKKLQKFCPDIENNLNKYMRQYYSYKDKTNEHIIFIYFIWKDEIRDYDISEPINFDDGCSHFWNIKYNTRTKKFFDLKINGTG